TDRFTYWPRRVAEGGDVLAPGDPGAPFQAIDARDLGAWLVRMAEAGPSGPFNCTGPADALTMGGALERLKATPGPHARLAWVHDATLEAAGLQPWVDLPFWTRPDGAGLMSADTRKALDAGLTFRPFEETVRDTVAWSRNAGTHRPMLAREREAEILADA